MGGINKEKTNDDMAVVDSKSKTLASVHFVVLETTYFLGI